MSENAIDNLTAVESEELRRLVANSIDRGEDYDEIIDELVAGGFSKVEATEFVLDVEFALATDDELGQENPVDEESGHGWLLWIGIAIGLIRVIFG